MPERAPDHLGELAAVVTSMIAERTMTLAQDETALDRPLWKTLDDLGFTRLTVPEDLGGSGGDLRDAAAVVRAAALSAIPLAEATFLAGPLLSAARLPWPGGVVTALLAPSPTAGPSRLSVRQVDREGGVALHGTLERVPWLRSADHLVLAVAEGAWTAVAVVATNTPGLTIRNGRNLAGEPRDDVQLEAVAPQAFARLGSASAPFMADALGALARSVQLSGAALQAQSFAQRHVVDRIQFGRPLIGFQAVQQQIARLISAALAMQVVVDAAVLAVHERSAAAPLLIAAAKTETSMLARDVAAIAHQLLGAMGFTREHRLAGCTQRLWSWREEYGNEIWWQDRIAELIDSAHGDLWGLLTNTGANEIEGGP